MTAPLRFALVPVEATVEMLDAGIATALSRNFYGNISEAAIDGSYEAMLAASPGNDLLERIVRARDKVNAPLCERTWVDACRAREEARAELMDALDELGGGHS